MGVATPPAGDSMKHSICYRMDDETNATHGDIIQGWDDLTAAARRVVAASRRAIP